MTSPEIIEAKNSADQIVEFNSINDVPYPNMLGRIVKAELRTHGYYACNLADKKVFMFLTNHI